MDAEGSHHPDQLEPYQAGRHRDYLGFRSRHQSLTR